MRKSLNNYNKNTIVNNFYKNGIVNRHNDHIVDRHVKFNDIDMDINNRENKVDYVIDNSRKSILKTLNKKDENNSNYAHNSMNCRSNYMNPIPSSFNSSMNTMKKLTLTNNPSLKRPCV